MPDFTIIQQLCIWIIPVLFAVTLHEVAHAYVAFLCGDNTAKLQGRLSLNPIHHIDWFGTLILPLIAGILTQFNFILGYAKPVPINWNQFRHPKRDIILVALAGPFANLLMAFLWAGGLKLAILLHPESSMPVLFLLAASRAGILVNLVLAFLNLLPLPPMDGSRVISSLLPANAAAAYGKIEPYGLIILALLVVSGGVGYILTPLINGSVYLLHLIYQL